MSAKACPQCGYLPPVYSMHLGYPVGDMVERCWLDYDLDMSDKDRVEQELARFFGVEKPSEIPQLVDGVWTPEPRWP